MVIIRSLADCASLSGRFRRCEAEGGDDLFDRRPATTLAAFSRMSGDSVAVNWLRSR
jgi:hypothetical protein